jgi:hypothetical protein
MVALEGDVRFGRVGLGRVVWFVLGRALGLQWMTLVILLCLD